MSWTFNGIRIYVNKKVGKGGQIIARLQPLDTTTLLHIFGHEGETMNVQGLVATSGDMQTLMGYRKTGTSYTFSGPEGIVNNYFVKDVKADRLDITSICLFDRPNLASDVPVYNASLELWIDE